MSEVETLSAWLTQAFIQLIAKHTGLKIREREQASLSEKIFLRMKALKIFLPEAYYQYLKSSTIDSRQEWQALISLLTNSESYFFRDKEQFNLLRNCILPEIIKRKQNSKTIRLCSAGCSTGEEPYSLAIILKELLYDLKQWNLMVLGLDINQEALEKAKQGIYTAWSLRSIDPKIMQRYFQFVNNQYYLDQEIRQMVKFEFTNLVKDSFFQPDSNFRDIDLILCRNVFIYFDASAIAQVVDNFYRILEPLGYLITGHTELCGQNVSKFQTKIFPESLVYIKKS